eukprot:403373467
MSVSRIQPSQINNSSFVSALDQLQSNPYIDNFQRMDLEEQDISFDEENPVKKLKLSELVNQNQSQLTQINEDVQNQDRNRLNEQSDIQSEVDLSAEEYEQESRLQSNLTTKRSDNHNNRNKKSNQHQLQYDLDKIKICESEPFPLVLMNNLHLKKAISNIKASQAQIQRLQKLSNTVLYQKLYVYIFWLHFTLKIDLQYNDDMMFKKDFNKLPASELENQQQKSLKIIDQTVILMLLREKIKRKYLKLFSLLPSPKDQFLDIIPIHLAKAIQYVLIHKINMGRQMFGNPLFQVQILKLVSEELIGIEISEPTAVKTVQLFQCEGEYRSVAASQILGQSPNRKADSSLSHLGQGDSFGQQQESKKDFIQMNKNSKISKKSPQKLLSMKSLINKTQNQILQQQQNDKLPKISKEQAKKQIKEKQIRFELERRVSKIFSNKIFSRSESTREDYADLKKKLKSISTRDNPFENHNKQSSEKQNIEYDNYGVPSGVSGNNLSNVSTGIGLQNSQLSKLLFQEYKLNKIKEDQEMYERQRKLEESERKRRETLRNEKRRLKTQGVKWKIGYNLDENGVVQQSKGLRKLHDLERLVNQDPDYTQTKTTKNSGNSLNQSKIANQKASSSSINLLRKMFQPKEPITQQQNHKQGGRRNIQISQTVIEDQGGIGKFQSEKIQEMKRNISVKDILQNRQQIQQSLLQKHMSQANLRDRSMFNSDKLTNNQHETSKERQKRLEHLKEWKKKNYFGGFDSDAEGDQAASLSYRSVDSVEVSEWRDIRNSSNYNRKFKYKK